MIAYRTTIRLLAGATFAGAVGFAGAAFADDEMTWSYATAQVGTCVPGSTCGQPTGPTVLRRESFVETNADYTNASVYRDDYSAATPYDYGMAWASAEAGDGTLGLPVLKAYALGGASGGATGFGGGPLTIAVNFAATQAVQGYTNTGDNALVIPLDAFTGLVDYQLFAHPSNPGVVSAGLAITTSAILDPAVSAQWWQSATGPGQFGQFAATCDTPGALALANPAPQGGATDGSVQYLPVTTSSCTGADTFLLNPGETFYVWARLAVLRAAYGATDASHTFNVTISPEAQADVEQNLLPNLSLADGSNFRVRTDAAIPEPSTWAMMILGFGAAGALLRRRRVATA
ncbi:MAG TPA: PEPxxWA-CTERM sorting domain-containing protein [Phenylobacterium sp.]